MNPRGQILSEASDRELVMAFQSGDRRAYDEIYRRHVPRVRRVCRRMLSNAQDIDEATQETFIKAYQALGRFNGSYLLGPWLGRIAANVCVDHLRSQSRSVVVPLGNDVAPTQTTDGPEEVLMANDPRVDAAIHQIRPLHARALELRAVHGLSHQEIAARLSMTPAQVKALLHRARESFRRAWDKAEGWILTPLVGLRSLGNDNSAGSSVVALPGWGLTSLGPSATSIADKVAAAAVAALLAFSPMGSTEPPSDESGRPDSTLSTTTRSAQAAPSEELSMKLAATTRIRTQANDLRTASGGRADTRSDSPASSPDAHEEPAEEPLLPDGVEPPVPPEPPEPPGGPGEGGDDPPVGPSGAGNHVRRIYKVVDDTLDSIPLGPGSY